MTPQRASVTIFADASYDPKTRRAGWAAWMKGAGKEASTVGGKIAIQCDASFSAETFATVNALYAARSRGYIVPGSVVMLQSDCLHALNVIRHHVHGATESKHPDGMGVILIRAKKLRRQDHDALAAIKKLMAETPFSIVVRHVRGHQTGRGRAWVNEQCDLLAKRHMREARRAHRRAGLMEAAE